MHMTNSCAGSVHFDATMQLDRVDISTASLARVLLRYPLISVRVITAIYTQALLLRLKKAPFHAHPKWKADQMEAKTS